MTARPNTERFEKLASFLERVMEDTGTSRRVRMSAAQRLDDLLARQERRDDAETRREERKAQSAEKAQQQAVDRETQPPSEEVAARDAERERELAIRKANEHLEKILGKS